MALSWQEATYCSRFFRFIDEVYIKIKQKIVFPFEISINMYPYPPVKVWSQRTINNDYFPCMNSSLTSLVPQRTHVNQTGLNSQKELKAKSRHQEVKKIQIPKTSEKYHMDLMQMNLKRTKRLKMLAIGKLPNILLFVFLKTKSW